MLDFATLKSMDAVDVKQIRYENDHPVNCILTFLSKRDFLTCDWAMQISGLWAFAAQLLCLIISVNKNYILGVKDDKKETGGGNEYLKSHLNICLYKFRIKMKKNSRLQNILQNTQQTRI